MLSARAVFHVERSLDVTLRGGAGDRMRITITTDVDPSDDWPPRAMQLDLHNARWTYVRVLGERTEDGDHIFQLAHRESADMITDYATQPGPGKVKYPWAWFG